MKDQPADRPPSAAKYVEAQVTVRDTRPDRGFAFGTAMINGHRTDVYIGSKAYAIQSADQRWENMSPHTPDEGDILFAKICIAVDPGKKPFAAFWCITSKAPVPRRRDYDDFVDDDYTSDDLDDLVVDETPCQYCDSWPCRCPEEY